MTTTPQIETASSRPQQRHLPASPARRRSRGHDWHGWLFAAPYVVFLIAFGLVPTGYAIYESLVDERITNQGARGIMNYRSLFADFRFWPAVENVGIFLLIWLPSMVVGVVVLALLLHDKLDRFNGFLRLLYFLPGAVTGSASVLLWYFMLQPSLSPFGPALRAIGYTSGNQVFQPGHLAAIFAIMAFTTGAGGWIVIMYGALQNIPHDIIEAASIDGCGPIRMALRIKLPNVTKYVLYMIILSFASGVQIFAEPQIIYAVTHAGTAWWSLNELSYSFAFDSGDLGSAAAVSVILLVISTLGAVALIAFTDFFSTEVPS